MIRKSILTAIILLSPALGLAADAGRSNNSSASLPQPASSELKTTTQLPSIIFADRDLELTRNEIFDLRASLSTSKIEIERLAKESAGAQRTLEGLKAERDRLAKADEVADVRAKGVADENIAMRAENARLTQVNGLQLAMITDFRKRDELTAKAAQSMVAEKQLAAVIAPTVAAQLPQPVPVPNKLRAPKWFPDKIREFHHKDFGNVLMASENGKVFVSIPAGHSADFSPRFKTAVLKQTSIGDRVFYMLDGSRMEVFGP